MRQATRTIPIVFVQVSDPVGQGIISSLARPGGNVTGFASTESAMAGKWLELLKGIAPRVSQLAVILNPENASNAGHFHAIEAVAPSVGVQVTWAGVRNATEIEPAIDVIARKTNAGLIVLASPTTNSNRELIVTLAARRHLPAVYPFRYFVTSGGLMSYGPNVPDLYRQAASYVDRILRGAKPSELPVQNPARFELVINLNTAKALGLDVPLHLQQLADDVIE